MNLALLLFAASPAFAQKKVFVSDNVLQVADQAQFDYKGMLKKATAKDGKAVAELFEFIRLLENAEADEHAMTCLELIPIATDPVFAKAVKSRNVKMKAALLRRITAAQQRTQKADLKKPMEKWAPYTWNALNNIDFIIEADNKAAQKGTATNAGTGTGTGVGQINTGTGAGTGIGTGAGTGIGTGAGTGIGTDAGSAKPDADKKAPAKRKDN